MGVNDLGLEHYLGEFESDYLAHGYADLSSFLPPDSHPQFQEIAVELMRSDMELCWQEHGDRRLDYYREHFPQVLKNDQNLDQVAFEEYRLRKFAGESVNREEYEQKYQIKTNHWPDFKTPIEERHHLEQKQIQSVSSANSEPQSDAKQLKTDSRFGGTGGNRSGIPDITTLEGRLHNRLRFISFTFTLLLVYLQSLVFLNPSEKVGLFLGNSFLIALNAICLIACVFICLYLRIRRSIPLQHLRVFEICLFGLVLLETSAGLYSDLFIDHELREPLLDDHSLFHYSSSWCLPYFALIIGYGTLVPSSWRRCTIMVSVIAVTPIVICTAAAGMERGLNQSFLQSFLLQMVLWMGMASAIAIYGVHRLETLERRLLRPGKLGKYRLIKQLGSGGMGSVYLAEDTLLQRNCALKLLLQHRQNDSQLLARFEREVQVLASISHANVVQIFDYGHSDGGVFYYAMEYLDGPNLEDTIRRKRKLKPVEVETIMLQIGSALKRVHQNGLVHRDVKPSNIIACDSDKAVIYKLLDFGVVKTTCLEPDDEHLTHDGAIIGTPAFMSPEQASGEPLDIRSDIYSLGAVAYYLLVGKPPFDKNTVVETLSAHIHEQPVSPRKLRPEVSDQLSNVVSRCLSKDPSERFANVSELETALIHAAT